MRAGTVGAVTGRTVTEHRDNPLQQGAELEVIGRIVPMGQDDGNRVPVSCRPPGVDVGWKQGLDDPGPSSRPGPVEQLGVVACWLLYLMVGEDSELLSSGMLLGKGPKIKSAKVWSLTIAEGGHPKQNPYSDLQFIFYFLFALTLTQFVDKMYIGVRPGRRVK